MRSFELRGIVVCRRLYAITGWFSLIALATLAIEPVNAEVLSENQVTVRNSESPKQLFKTDQNNSSQPLSFSAKDLLVQNSEGIARITGVQINPTDSGLELILETSNNQQLIPLILPEGDDLVVDILDATLAADLENGFRQINPAPGISQITITEVDQSSIRVRITGETQVPSAEIIPSQNNLVLGVTPENVTPQAAPDEEFEIVATGEAEDDDDYLVPDTTITRNNTPIIETPGSIQVIPEQVIEDQGATKFSDAFRSAVGVTPVSSPVSNFNNFIIRGFSANSNFLRNGISEGSTILQPPRDLSNVERLEILLGPASIVGGQISPGGIINVVTKQPLLSPFYEFSGSYGSFDTVEGAFDFSGPLNESETLAYRLNASIYHSDTFIDADDVDIDRLAIAPVLSWQISEQTKLTFEGLYLDSRTPQRIGLPIQGTVVDNPNGEVPRERFVGEPEFDRNDRQLTRIGYDLQHDFNEDWSLRHAFSYFNYQLDQREAFVNAIQDDLRTLERSGDLFQDDINSYQATAYITGEFQTGDVNHQLLAGVDYVFEEDYYEFNFFEAENIDLFDPEYAGGVGEPFEDAFGRGRDTRDGIGVYLQDQIKMFDERLILVLGGRVDFVEASFNDFLDGAEAESQDNSAFSPRVGILYQLTDSVSVYGSFSRSFEQEIGRSADDETFEPTRGTQYEVGLKANWLDDRLLTSLAFYDLTLTNVLTEDPDDPNFEIQTGEQNSQGIELQTVGEIAPGWNIIASYSYINAEITEDNVLEVGNSLPNVPQNTASLWTTYTISQGDFSGLGFGLGLFYVGEREGDLDNSFELDSYLRTDAAVYYRQENLNLTLNLKNIFDVEYIESASDDLRAYFGDPFTVLFTATYEF